MDHAWASLLANGRVIETPFEQLRFNTLTEGGVEMTALFFVARDRTKMAVLLELKNVHGTAPWRLGETRLTSDASPFTPKPFALRMDRPEIDPRASGNLAVVVDRREFTTEKGLVDLTLAIAQKEGPLQMMILLDWRLLEEKKR
ncbi:DUF2381 family protein [Cystobacter ferrugineus]|uniref:DUF2381 family protein n=1 Tax=Cystobacter ferrugineus TaxID=83449 RepID=UPI000A9DE896